MGRRRRGRRDVRRAPPPHPVDLMTPEQLEEVYERMVLASPTARRGSEAYLKATAARGHLDLRRTRRLREAWA